MDKNIQEEINSKYKNGQSVRQLSKDYGFSRRTINKYLILNGSAIEFRDNKKRKFKLRENYFEIIDNPKKAYFLGFLFADGYILKDGYTSGITLANTDRNTLEILSQEIYGSPLAVYDIKKMQTNKTPQSRLVFKSREFQKHLLDKNLVHNKSLILTPPKNIPNHLIKYFILGYFDGDGCFSKPTLSIVSTKIFCEWIGEFLLTNKVISHYRLVTTKNLITHRILIWRRADIASIYKYFYEDNNFTQFLDRKRQKMFDYLNKPRKIK